MSRMATTDDDSDDEDAEVFAIGSEIHFHGEITSAKAMALIKLVSRYVDSLRAESDLTIYVHSHGGCAFSGLAMYDYLTRVRAVRVHTVAYGLVASAATFLFLAGEKRTVTPFATLLIHQIRTCADGYQKLNDAREDVQNNERIQETIRRLYERRTRIPKKRLGAFFVNETYLDAAECVELGLATETEEPKKRKRA